MQKSIEERIPVIVGIGECIDRPAHAAEGLEPLRLMERAARNAERDAGADVLGAVDSVDVVCEVSWPYPAAPARLCALLGMHPQRAVYGPIGGETPLRFLHEAAIRIAEGLSEVALVVGAEAEYSVGLARKTGVSLPWESRDNTPIIRGNQFMHPQAVLHGIATPSTAYPLFENAATAAWKQSPRTAQDEAAALWERYAAVAAENPFAWLPKAITAAEIRTPGPANRMIAFPYPKSMVANPMVNQGAAVIITSLARARAAGVPEHKRIYIFGGAAADEPRDYLDRAQLDRSHAQSVVLETVLRDVGGDAGVFSAAELYSCFPIVPKIALRILQAPELLPTVTGGLSFFGAPLNNYMTHAVAAMVRHLRSRQRALGLLYGNGGFMSYHHALVLTSDPARANERLKRDYRVQAEADARQLPAPAVIADYAGTAVLETFTVMYDRNSAPAYGSVIARTPQDERVLARVPGADALGIRRLLDAELSPVGAGGHVAPASDGMLHWRFG
ncbi:acetyl-CoA acetyltransferase [Noviherbaspirillum sedimenti]|uniref:Acetyl-CoA acetyltransferase n=1 Tax=Noviherbaspirillum sedimenti TaxID=2320865 RepID=A0A3A3FYW1_9BURK|nr:acetyl-CoA acetyltransferase [Noviherbaspirillum sedimenti]RJG00821.1 acetyl-CoA acetyltransferase [Noviherbaspirillum sedimenti]